MHGVLQTLVPRPWLLQHPNLVAEIWALFEAGHRAFWNAHLEPAPPDGVAAACAAALSESADAGDSAATAHPEDELAVLYPGAAGAGGSATLLLTGLEISQPVLRHASTEDRAAPPGGPVATAPLRRLHIGNAAVHTNLLSWLCSYVTQPFVCSPEELEKAQPGQPSWTISQHLQTLECLDMSGARIGAAALPNMVATLQTLGGLRELRLADCSMSAMSLGMLCTYVGGSAKLGDLTRIDWSGNAVAEGEEGRTAFGMLSKLTALQDLRLQRCGIRRGTAQVLAQALTAMRALRRVDLARNGLGADGAAAVVAAAAALPQLQYLQCGAAYGVDAAAAREELPEGVVFELDP